MEELIKAVQEALQAEPIRPNGSFTTEEFRTELTKRLGATVNRKRARRMLGELKGKGKIKVVESIPIRDISDRDTTVKGWTWVRET